MLNNKLHKHKISTFKYLTNKTEKPSFVTHLPTEYALASPKSHNFVKVFASTNNNTQGVCNPKTGSDD
jgi:hypothetical protein